MRILHLTPFYPPAVTGGAELYVHDLAREQAAAGHDVHVVTVTRAAAPADRRDGVLVHSIAYWSSVWLGDPPGRYSRYHRALAAIVRPFSLRALLRFDRIVKQVRPDIIHAHTMNGLSTSMWSSPRLRGIPLIHTLHDFSQICARSNLFRNGEICSGRCLNCRLATESNRVFESCVDAVVGVGSDILDRHLAAGRFTKVPAEFRVVIGNPIGYLDNMVPRSVFPADDAPFTFGLMSRLVPEKGVEAVLAACAALPEDLNWRLRLAGSDSGAIELDQWRNRLPPERFEVVGWIDPKVFLPTLDVLLAPSIWADPFGRTAIEAYCFGVPVLATRVGGLQHLVEDGRTGWLVPPGNVGALVRRLIQLIKAGRRSLPRGEVFTEATAPYRSSIIAATHQSLYERVLQRRTAH